MERNPETRTPNQKFSPIKKTVGMAAVGREGEGSTD